MAHITNNTYQGGGKEVSEQELEYRVKYDNTGSSTKKSSLCTICTLDLSPKAVLKGDVFSHPELGVLLCKKCYNRHKNNYCNFSQLCSWCGLTGKFKTCGTCLSDFCFKCLKNNLDPEEYIKTVRNKSWSCLICSPEPLWEQRAICAKMLNSLVYTKQPVCVGQRRKRTLSTVEPTAPLKRNRSNSWGGSDSQENNENGEAVINKSQHLITENEVEKLPTENDCTATKEELLHKAQQLSLLFTNVTKRLEDFENKITVKTMDQKLVKKAYEFESNLIDTTMKTLTLWKMDLQKINDKWYKEFKVSLSPMVISENEQPNENLNEPIPNKHHSKDKKRNRLSLKRSSDTQVTDDEVENNDQSIVLIPEVINEAGPSSNLNHISNKTTENNIELPDEPQMTQSINDTENNIELPDESQMIQSINERATIENCCKDDSGIKKTEEIVENDIGFPDDLPATQLVDLPTVLESNCKDDASINDTVKNNESNIELPDKDLPAMQVLNVPADNIVRTNESNIELSDEDLPAMQLLDLPAVNIVKTNESNIELSDEDLPTKQLLDLPADNIVKTTELADDVLPPTQLDIPITHENNHKEDSDIDKNIENKNNVELPDEDLPPTQLLDLHELDDSDDHSIFSQATVILESEIGEFLSNDEPALQDKTENIVELTGQGVVQKNKTRKLEDLPLHPQSTTVEESTDTTDQDEDVVIDDTESEASFVFDINGYTSDLSPINEIEEYGPEDIDDQNLNAVNKEATENQHNVTNIPLKDTKQFQKSSVDNGNNPSTSSTFNAQQELNTTEVAGYKADEQINICQPGEIITEVIVKEYSSQEESRISDFDDDEVAKIAEDRDILPESQQSHGDNKETELSEVHNVTLQSGESIETTENDVKNGDALPPLKSPYEEIQSVESKDGDHTKGDEFLTPNNSGLNEKNIEVKAVEKDDTFCETSADNLTLPLMRKSEDLQSKIEFFESLELSYSEGQQQEMSDENTIDSDNEGLKNALNLLDEDDDYLFLSDMDVSSSSSKEDGDNESYEIYKNKPTKEIGVVVNQFPVLPSQSDSDVIENTSEEELELVISNTTSEEIDKPEVNIYKKFDLKTCKVVLERVDNIPEMTVKTPKLTPEKNELREIERLTNLDNLETIKRKVQSENEEKKKRKRRKIIKPTGSPASKSESNETDSDCDGIIPSSLQKLDEEFNKPWGIPSPISHDVNISTPDEDVLDQLLEGITSDLDASSEDSDQNEDTDKPRKKKKKRRSSADSNKENEPTNKQTNEEEVVKEPAEEERDVAEKKKWRNDPLLCGKLTETDSGADSDSTVEGENILSEKTKHKMEELEKKMLKRKAKRKDSETKSKSTSNSDVEINSGDDLYNIKDANAITIKSDTDSDIEFISEIKKRTPLKKRKNEDCIIIKDEDDDNDDNKSIKSDSDNSDTESESGNKKKGRRNIRAILSDETLEEETKRANLIEKQRKDRLTQKQKHMDSVLSQSFHLSTEERLILDVDEKSNKPIVAVHAKLSNRLKNHQKAGVRFMWNCCYEGVKQIQQDAGSGCILAHCMGLGKTFQVVTLIHTLFAHEITETKHVLIVCPLSLVLNWEDEFKKGLEGLNDGVKINLFCISDRCSTPIQRLYIVEKWRQSSGVLIMGYEAYQRLIQIKDTQNLTKQEKNIKKILVNPGPDLVVIDEGHLLKSGKNDRTKALMGVKTKRRIILTGTPLQNNLTEYYYMVQFVKPNLLGSYHEYTNRFVNPITNGQYDDSTDADIVQMKKRSHVLHKLLRATIQRYEVSELRSYLPEKYDYVLFIQLHSIQASLYEKYISLLTLEDNIIKKRLFADYTVLQRISTHPYLLHLQKQEKKNKQKKETKEVDVINLDPEEKECDELLPNDWWESLFPEDYRLNIDYGPKFKVMLSIIQECEKIGDKVLIFSNSLKELDVIELFLQQHETPTSQWKPKEDFYRMDGQVAPDVRLKLCNSFNDKNNKRTRVFLISHRVGGLGLNLVAANRVILMDVSWNPAHDSQSVFRAYRFGQEKKCYIYRLVTMGTMEEVVYERQVTKLAIAGRVVDEMQISRHYKSNDLQKMYRINFKMDQERPPLHIPVDILLARILQIRTEIFKYHEHQALLENLPEEELNEDEMKLAWDEFNKENEHRNHLLEQQKKKMTGPQPGSSGVNSFLPSFFSKQNGPAINESYPTYIQYLKHPQQINGQPVLPNQAGNRFILNKTKNTDNTNTTNQGRNQPQGRFETVFVPGGHNKQVYNTQETTRYQKYPTLNEKASELQKKFHSWVRETTSRCAPVPVTSTSTLNVQPPTTTIISHNKNITTSSFSQNNTVTMPVITSVAGATSAQSCIVPKITSVVGASSHQNDKFVIPKIINVTGGSSVQNNAPVIPKITNVTGAVTDQNKGPVQKNKHIKDGDNQKQMVVVGNKNNQITLMKIQKRKQSSIVMNPVNSNNSITLSKNAKKDENHQIDKNHMNKSVINLDDDPDEPETSESFRAEQQELLNSLRENLNITLSALSKPNTNSIRAPEGSTKEESANVNNNPTQQRNNDDVIEID